MGATYDRLHNDYTIGLMLLVATALVAFGYTKFQLGAHEPANGRPKPRCNQHVATS